MSTITTRKGAYVTVPAKTYNNVTSGTSANVTLSATASIARVAVNADTWVALAGTVYTANATLMTAGATEFFAVDNSSKIAFMQVTTAGNISIAELGGTGF
jgi:hypothetical protein